MTYNYVKPTIHKLQTGLMNKFGASPYYARKVRTEIDGASIDSLVEKYGSPLFVFSESTIRQTIRETKDAFSTRYHHVTFGWSYKTNYLDAISAIFHQEGSVAEVVSEMEYEKARRLGVAGENIIFNGPAKSMTALKRAAEEGAKIHIDHFDEIEDLEKIADLLGKEIPVAIRLNLDAGIQPQWNRFGFNLESGQAMDAARRIHMGGKLRMTGLHCHIGTFILDPEGYANQVRKMVQFGYQLEETLGFHMEYYDLGGGIPSASRLKGVYLSPDVTVPAMDSYAEKICEALYDSLKPNDYPHLYLECGRALIDEAGYLISSVLASKRLPNGQKSYIMDAGVNLLYTSTWYKYTLEMDREVHGVGEPSILNGPLCMNIDVIDEGTLLPPLHRGTRIILSPVGAYNVTQWMQFIEYRPAIVLVAESGEVELIREREDLTDMVRRECLPERLQLENMQVS